MIVPKAAPSGGAAPPPPFSYDPFAGISWRDSVARMSDGGMGGNGEEHNGFGIGHRDGCRVQRTLRAPRKNQDILKVPQDVFKGARSHAVLLGARRRHRRRIWPSVEDAAVEDAAAGQQRGDCDFENVLR